MNKLKWIALGVGVLLLIGLFLLNPFIAAGLVIAAALVKGFKR